MSLSEAFRQQADSCEKLGSPFMGQLLRLLSERWKTGTRLDKRFAQFSGDIGPAGASLPLRTAGGLHALVLTGRAPELASAYPPHQVSDDILWSAVSAALQTHEDFILNWVESPPQTNEVRRSVALIPAACVVAEHFDLPFVLSELGASAGLNLMWDHYEVALPGMALGSKTPALTLSPDWDGQLPPGKMPVVAARAGVDLNPLDPKNPDDLLRLTAYLWPDQPFRMGLTRAAAGITNAPIAQDDAIDWLEARLKDTPKKHVHLIQHTVAWQYFPAEIQARGTDMIEAAGRAATQSQPLAWLAMESDGDKTGAVGAALTLRMWPGDITLNLGRADFHGRWIKWQVTGNQDRH